MKVMMLDSRAEGYSDDVFGLGVEGENMMMLLVLELKVIMMMIIQVDELKVMMMTLGEKLSADEVNEMVSANSDIELQIIKLHRL